MNKIIFDMPRAEYDALSFDNYSSLKRIGRSPWHYKWAKDHPDSDDTDARKFGRAAHLAVLEPDAYLSQTVVWLEGARRGKQWEEFAARNVGREILTPAEAARIDAVRDAVARSEYAKELTSGGQAEVTLLWDTEIVPGFVVPCRSRLDYVTPKAIVDLKLTRNASPEAFGRQSWDLGYLGQAAFYSDAYERVTGKRLPFVFLAVENEDPFSVAAYRVTDEQMAAGRDDYVRFLSILSLCRIKNEWPSYATAPMPLVLPPWAAKQAEALSNAANLEAMEAEHG